jgi:excisionase family DNA binding protein
MNSAKSEAHSGRKFLYLSEFCERYRCSRSTAYRLAQSGAITIVKRGRSSLISMEQADSWAATLPALGA